MENTKTVGKVKFVLLSNFEVRSHVQYEYMYSPYIIYFIMRFYSVNSIMEFQSLFILYIAYIAYNQSLNLAVSKFNLQQFTGGSTLGPKTWLYCRVTSFGVVPVEE